MLTLICGLNINVVYATKEVEVNKYNNMPMLPNELLLRPLAACGLGSNANPMQVTAKSKKGIALFLVKLKINSLVSLDIIASKTPAIKNQTA